jgi:undecaprenyl-diphosphatase
MDSWQAFLLGLIEGITEYLPVSSTGHLLVAQHFMGLNTGDPQAKAAADAFAICIQGGAILAVLGLYWPHVLRMLKGLLGRDAEGFQMGLNVVVGFLPAAAIGVLLDEKIEALLFGTWPVVAAWIVGGIAILLTAGWRKRRAGEGEGLSLVQMTWRMALIIGFLQCVAMWPGTSRSLMTIVGGLLVGLSVRAAVEYSFLLGVITLTAATAKKAVWKLEGLGETYDAWFGGARLMWDSYGATPLVVGLAAATVSASLAVKWLVTYLERHGLAVFGWYRIALGLLVAGLMMAGMLPN